MCFELVNINVEVDKSSLPASSKRGYAENYLGAVNRTGHYNLHSTLMRLSVLTRITFTDRDISIFCMNK